MRAVILFNEIIEVLHPGVIHTVQRYALPFAILQMLWGRRRFCPALLTRGELV